MNKYYYIKPPINAKEVPLDINKKNSSVFFLSPKMCQVHLAPQIEITKNKHNGLLLYSEKTIVYTLQKYAV